MAKALVILGPKIPEYIWCSLQHFGLLVLNFSSIFFSKLFSNQTLESTFSAFARTDKLFFLVFH